MKVWSQTKYFRKKKKKVFGLATIYRFLESFPPFAILFLFLNLFIACQVASYTISCKKLWAKISTKLFLPNFKVIFSLISGSNQTEFPSKVSFQCLILCPMDIPFYSCTSWCYIQYWDLFQRIQFVFIAQGRNRSKL